MRPTERLEDIFHAALERAPSERAEFLQGACDGDEDLRQEVESLLLADNSAAEFLETAVVKWPGVQDPREADFTPTAIGPFKVIRAIASGGMGTVYEARQQEPRRTVAVKLLRAGLATSSAARRFADEAQVLSRLSHPGIAQVIAAGTYQEGALRLPYFAMEFVPDAHTLLEYAGAKHLSRQARLELFIEVCDAVGHGHQRGIIHRDIKPGNILVGADGRPKVIDFGIARALDSETAPGAPQTVAGQWLGTLAYMSPEQCGPDPHTVDIRTDVYSLGVVLYELIGGRRPYEVDRVSIAEAGRIIRENVPPPLPATRMMHADVATIVQKSLEKDSARRYRSAADLADDIRRFLDNRPIEARPASSLYQLRKWVSRHRAVSTLVAGIMVLVTSFLIVFAAQSRRIRDERNVAAAAAHRAGQISDFLRGVLELIEPANKGLEISGGELLERSVHRIDNELTGEPAVQAELREHIGCIYARLGKFDEAERLLRASHDYYCTALGTGSREAANSAYSLACMLFDRGDYAAAQPLWEAAYEAKRQLYGDADPRVAFLINPVALRIGHEGNWLRAKEMLHPAVKTLQSAYPKGSLELAITLSNLAIAHRNCGDLSDAERLLRESLAMKRALLDPTHWHIAATLGDLGRFLMDTDRAAEAEPLLRQCLDRRTAQLPPGHWRIAETQSELGRCLLRLGRREEARSLLEDSHAALLSMFGPLDPRTQRALASVDESQR